jgi:hypothetical protein
VSYTGSAATARGQKYSDGDHSRDTRAPKDVMWTECANHGDQAPLGATRSQPYISMCSAEQNWAQ